MPNVRGSDQKGVLVMMRESFLEEIDAALPKAGFSDRSKFIRDAVYQRMKAMGFNVREEAATAPSRKGKGGRPSHYKIKEAAPSRTTDAPAKVTEERHKVLRYGKADRPKKTKRTKE
jgi:acetate kinase